MDKMTQLYVIGVFLGFFLTSVRLELADSTSPVVSSSNLPDYESLPETTLIAISTSLPLSFESTSRLISENPAANSKTSSISITDSTISETSSIKTDIKSTKSTLNASELQTASFTKVSLMINLIDTLFDEADFNDEDSSLGITIFEHFSRQSPI